jgi:hypothetical protein
MLTKVVYNACHGGFSLSLEALERMQELGFKGETYYDCARHNPILVQAVEEFGPKAGGLYADLRIALVAGPYRIEEYDGSETVYEPCDYDWITP